VGWREKARMGSDIAVVVAHKAHERIWAPTLGHAGEVPGTIEDITPHWMTDALCRHHPGAQVTRIFFGPRDEGSNSRRTLALGYNRAGRDADLPARVFVKASASLKSRIVTGLTGLADTEIGFYQTIRPDLALQSPMAMHTARSPKARSAIIVLDDVSAVDDVTWTDPRTTHIDRDLAASMLETMSAYHGPLWTDARLAKWPWLRSATAVQDLLDATIDFPGRLMAGIHRSHNIIPNELFARRDEIYPALKRALAQQDRQPATLVHQDTHLRNWYATSDRRMGIFDWQAAASGCWAIDVSYALGAALTVDDRRRWERNCWSTT
jgi:hypothetical protein